MTRHVLTLRNEAERFKVIEWLKRAAYGHRIEVKEPKRSDLQNDRMWWLLTAISKQLIWHGKQYSKEKWKDYFMHCLCGGEWMPSEDGGMVPIGRSSSDLSVAMHGDLMTIIEAFCARNGVELNYEEDRPKRIK